MIATKPLLQLLNITLLLLAISISDIICAQKTQKKDTTSATRDTNFPDAKQLKPNEIPHRDHTGGTGTLWMGGAIGNQPVKLTILKPDSTQHKWEEAYAIGGKKKYLAWDWTFRQWWLEYPQKAGLVINESFMLPIQMITKMHFPQADAVYFCNQVHTVPTLFIAIMNTTSCSMAIAYHGYNNFDAAPEILKSIRSIYQESLSLATDHMIQNVTNINVVTRMIVVNGVLWPLSLLTRTLTVDQAKKVDFTPFLFIEKLFYKKLSSQTHKKISKAFGTDFEPPD
ncbi:hypothetical protein BTJ40_15590 [Microbulbifer sp. A4B17]|uniref:hypothetical protein n=1 Tax=Microbulbifer sp. A4B17 TaxID=359370 RepID=UPI000D52D0D3|nr:hypothetical protein [Microbulbifer sp. A4B17]AWF82140.1 hypothetical protein BTJ40_15590 [Microbulbifer sp. A4B17]